jgi:hypothetical protein
MKQLDAIGEMHPLNIIYEVLTNSYYGERIEERIKNKYFRPQMGLSACLAKSNPFWKALENDIKERGRAYHKDERKAEAFDTYPTLLSDTEFDRLEELTLKQIQIARNIWAAEVAVIEDGEYKVVYLESRDPNPLESIAVEQGARVVLLDYQNQYFDKLSEIGHMFAGAYAPKWMRDEWQRQREGIWVQRIDQPGLLIAGYAHVEGQYGLPKTLENNGVHLNKVKDFKGYEASLEEMRQARKEILDNGLEKYLESL